MLSRVEEAVLHAGDDNVSSKIWALTYSFLAIGHILDIHSMRTDYTLVCLSKYPADTARRVDSSLPSCSRSLSKQLKRRGTLESTVMNPFSLGIRNPMWR